MSESMTYSNSIQHGLQAKVRFGLDALECWLVLDESTVATFAIQPNFGPDWPPVALQEYSETIFVTSIRGSGTQALLDVSQGRPPTYDLRDVLRPQLSEL